jgi:hypothetical protein
MTLSLNHTVPIDTQFPAPFHKILQPYASAIPPVFRDQYLLTADSTYWLRLKGEMKHIWHKDKWRWPYFWALAQFDIIFPESGHNIPAEVCIKSGYDGVGRPFHQWQRSYYFPCQTRYSNARLVYDEKLRQPVEIFRPANLMHVVWDVQFEAPNRIVIRTTGFFLQIGHFRLHLPHWLRGDVLAVETADSSRPDFITIDFTLAYPQTGTVFAYEGSFQATRQIRHSNFGNC